MRRGVLTIASAALAGACARPAPVPPAPAPATAPADTTVAMTPAVARPARAPFAFESARAHRVADSVLALMTLDEKVGQLTMAPAQWNQTGPAAPAGGDSLVRAGKLGSFLSFWGAEPTRRMQRIAVEESRLKIPLLFSQDVIHGWRTVFPVSLAEAATFDSAAVAGAARIAAVEATAHGIHWTFAPMVDIARDARWGRIVEGSGEDPYLGSVMAAARVRGFQGDDLAAANTMLATAKHFAAYGAAEAGRDYNVADVSERTLWEVYLPPFDAAVRAGAGSLMASFNEIGGTPAHASDWLLTDVLRRRWGFGGLVVSDWTGVAELQPHGIAADTAEAARRALRAGVDIEMSSAYYRASVPELIRAGRLTMATVDSAVHRVLRVKQALGLFDDPYRYSDTTRQRDSTLTPAHRAAARDVARKAIVLLRNDTLAGGRPVLPLPRTLRSVAVIGPLAADARSALGNWAGAGRAEDVVTPLAGIREALPNARVTHAVGAPSDSMRTDSIASAVRLAQRSDAVILVLGEREEMSAEAASRASIELPGAQLQLALAVIRAVRQATPRKPIVAVLMNGRPFAVAQLDSAVPALVESWYLGVEHGHALADILFGDASPSGRLPASMPRTTGQVPIYHAHKNTGRPPVADQKYTSKYLDVPWTPLYPFGHGLSYTTFAYSNLRVASADVRAGDSVVVEVDVRNSGGRDGEEVVQLYLRDDAASVTRPVRALCGFRRVPLRAGESRTVRFVLAPEALALYDLDMRRVIEPGTFTLWAGGSSAATLEARFRVTGDTLVLAPAPPRMR